MTACASRCSSACLLRQITIVKKMRGTGVVPLDKSGHISRLRYKLEADPKAPSLIRTVRNGGYIFETEVARG